VHLENGLRLVIHPQIIVQGETFSQEYSLAAENDWNAYNENECFSSKTYG
jgi:hypothetical protein